MFHIPQLFSETMWRRASSNISLEPTRRPEHNAFYRMQLSIPFRTRDITVSNLHWTYMESD